MAPHSSSLAWRIPWTEEPGGLQSMGRRESGVTEHSTYSAIDDDLRHTHTLLVTCCLCDAHLPFQVPCCVEHS